MSKSISGMHDPYEDQLAAARYRAERDQARQELDSGAQDAENRRVELCAMLDVDPGTGWSDAMECMRRRLMPEDMEWLLEVWPKWSNGEYCRFGDWWKSEKYGEDEPKKFRKLSIFTPEQLDEWGQGNGDSYGYEWDFVRPSNPDYRPDKVEPPAPTVLAADGEPLEVGQTVWDTNGDELVIGALEDGGHTVACRYADVGDSIPVHGMWSPSDLTHQRPVLDADGVPIKKGDTVWSLTDGKKHEVTGINPRFGDIRVKDESMELGVWDSADGFTHAKPEIDTWQRIEEDAEKDPCGYFGFDGEETCGKCPASGKNCEQTMALDIVRRAKALAGVSE